MLRKQHYTFPFLFRGDGLQNDKLEVLTESEIMMIKADFFSKRKTKYFLIVI